MEENYLLKLYKGLELRLPENYISYWNISNNFKGKTYYTLKINLLDGAKAVYISYNIIDNYTLLPNNKSHILRILGFKRGTRVAIDYINPAEDIDLVLKNILEVIPGLDIDNYKLDDTLKELETIISSQVSGLLGDLQYNSKKISVKRLTFSRNIAGLDTSFLIDNDKNPVNIRVVPAVLFKTKEYEINSYLVLHRDSDSGEISIRYLLKDVVDSKYITSHKITSLDTSSDSCKVILRGIVDNVLMNFDLKTEIELR